MEKDISWKQKKAGVATFTPDKIDFNAKPIRDNEGPNNSTSWYLSEEVQCTQLKRHTRVCVHCSIIYNSQDTGATCGRQ